MAEVRKADLMPISFLRMSVYTGSLLGMRYRMEKMEKETDLAAGVLREAGNSEETEKHGETRLLVSVWKGPYAYPKMEESDFRRRDFPFTPEGIEEARRWLNEEYEAGEW